MGSYRPPGTVAPQDACHHSPCWCGRGDLPEKPKPPQGYKPFSKKRAAEWLKSRQKAREATHG